MVTKLNEAMYFRKALRLLREYGMLLESDLTLPSLSGLILGASVRGSWWGHPARHSVFRLTRKMMRHRDVVVTKLVSGKVTYVHRRFWPAILALGRTHKSWQLMDLSRDAQQLLHLVKKELELRTDHITWKRRAHNVGRTVRELERRILVHTEEFHTSGGAHAKRVETWQHWAKKVGLKGQSVTAAQAERDLEGVVREWNERFGGKGKLPWLLADGSNRVGKKLETSDEAGSL